MDVQVDLVQLAIVVNPNIIVCTTTSHITVEVTICFTLPTATSCVLPDTNFVMVSRVLEVDVVKPGGSVDAAELDISSDAIVTLAGVCDACAPPFGYLFHKVSHLC